MGNALYLVTYDRGTYLNTSIPKPYHWSFFVQKEIKGKVRQGIAYQLRGIPGAFHYDGPEEVDLGHSGSLKEELLIGEGPEDKFEMIHQRLKECKIDSVESSSWNCPDWALEGFEKLKTEGFVYDIYTVETVRAWLREK
ncbi:hypothetical protein PAAG_11067 [Paracoccidioides lutzii Pb01]|uniref:Uncharacterized protein n=1 Tax=Paracoccidioides lutzii (strain ATCC MYA-826 / Pb01) TaxID=502779 RepID=A0A0A2V2W3_PARBA|nr:hypothetical protein PAAG_11067 [Paracoccidioides lutzii Pb01]KGQ02116.1 hypothetical protein PAAG_11067 [Paracoccidioides lutzii Pb01]